MTPTELANHGTSVVAGMSGNADFPSPNPPLATITGLVKKVVDGQLEIKDMENQTGVLRDTLHADTDELRRALGDEGNTVQGVADRAPDEAAAIAVIKGANMEVRDEAKPIGALPAPQKASLVDAHDDGALDAHCSKIRGAYSYFFETCLGNDPINGAWGNGKPSGNTSITLTGFTLGTRVWMRCCGVGAAGMGDWSQPVSDIVT